MAHTTPLVRRSVVALAAALLAASALPAARVSAASATSLYAYDLAHAGARVANGAVANAGVDLRLEGNWSSNATGVIFQGNLSSKRSVASAKPGSGATLDVAGGKAIGAAVVFTFAPPSGASCPKDSQNVTQVGPFASGQSQVKLQLSTCESGVVLPQCRFAGAATPSSAAPVTGSSAIVPGRSYRLECVKGPDASGKATVTMRVTDVASGSTATKSFTIPDTGRIHSWKALSVANKHPLPSYSKNTDQFTGTVRRLGLCSGDTTAAVQACLESAAAG